MVATIRTNRADRARRCAFDSLHTRPGAFVIPNPWDAGSAKMLAALGFEALATTSAGFAFSLGRPDAEGAVDRDDTLTNIRAIVDATTLPVSADLENGFGDDPEVVRRDHSARSARGPRRRVDRRRDGTRRDPIYPFALSVDRVAAAVAAARALPFPFMLTARAENLINGRPDLADTIRRLQAFAEAGADVLYAPGLKTSDEIARVVKRGRAEAGERRHGPFRRSFLAVPSSTRWA